MYCAHATAACLSWRYPPLGAGPGPSNVDAVVVDHQIGVADVQGCADVHELIKAHDRGLKCPANPVIEEPIPSGEARSGRQHGLRLGLSCVWRRSPLIAVGFLTPQDIAVMISPWPAKTGRFSLVDLPQIQAALSIPDCPPVAQRKCYVQRVAGSWQLHGM